MTSTQTQSVPTTTNIVDEVKTGTVDTLLMASQEGMKKMPYRISQPI